MSGVNLGSFSPLCSPPPAAGAGVSSLSAQTSLRLQQKPAWFRSLGLCSHGVTPEQARTSLRIGLHYQPQTNAQPHAAALRLGYLKTIGRDALPHFSYVKKLRGGGSCHFLRAEPTSQKGPGSLITYGRRNSNLRRRAAHLCSHSLLVSVKGQERPSFKETAHGTI